MLNNDILRIDFSYRVQLPDARAYLLRMMARPLPSAKHPDVIIQKVRGGWQLSWWADRDRPMPPAGTVYRTKARARCIARGVLKIMGYEPKGRADVY